jgi:hypothetical protein
MHAIKGVGTTMLIISCGPSQEKRIGITEICAGKQQMKKAHI